MSLFNRNGSIWDIFTKAGIVTVKFIAAIHNPIPPNNEIMQSYIFIFFILEN